VVGANVQGFAVDKASALSLHVALELHSSKTFCVLKYVGAILTEDNDTNTENKQQTIMVNKTSKGLKKQLHSPVLKRHTKCMLHKNL
jgi:hypothetical protein